MLIQAVAVALLLVGMPLALAAGAASAVELLEASVTAGGAAPLENNAGTVRLEQPRLDSVESPVFVVPEPAAIWQLAAGVGGLAFLRARRRRARRSPGTY